mgnify:CR=1 FL=1
MSIKAGAANSEETEKGSLRRPVKVQHWWGDRNIALPQWNYSREIPVFCRAPRRFFFLFWHQWMIRIFPPSGCRSWRLSSAHILPAFPWEIFITDAVARKGLKKPFIAASSSWIDVLENAGVAAVHWSAIGAEKCIGYWNYDWRQSVRLYPSTSWSVFQRYSCSHAGRKTQRSSNHRAEDVNRDVIGSCAIAALRQIASELEEAALLTIDATRARIRLLP